VISYFGNVLNQKAVAFYRRHGVRKIDTAAESGLDMHGKKVMITRYCLKYELGICPTARVGQTEVCPTFWGTSKEPLYLIDEDGRKLKLQFNCRNCQMEIYYERLKGD